MEGLGYCYAKRIAGEAARRISRRRGGRSSNNEAIAKHQEAAVLELKPWEASVMEEQALRVADLCRYAKGYRDKVAEAYEGKS